MHLIVGWMASALALWLVAQIMPGIRVRDFRAALIATLVIGVANAVVGPVARFIAWPLTIVTLGLFLLVINAFLLKLAEPVLAFAAFSFLAFLLFPVLPVFPFALLLDFFGVAPIFVLGLQLGLERDVGMRLERVKPFGQADRRQIAACAK